MPNFAEKEKELAARKRIASGKRTPKGISSMFSLEVRREIWDATREGQGNLAKTRQDPSVGTASETRLEYVRILKALAWEKRVSGTPQLQK